MAGMLLGATYQPLIRLGEIGQRGVRATTATHWLNVRYAGQFRGAVTPTVASLRG